MNDEGLCRDYVDDNQEQPRIEIFSENYCVTVRSTKEIMSNLQINESDFTGQDVLIVGDGIYCELAQLAIINGAKTVTVVDPTLGFTSEEWFAFHGDILTGRYSGNRITFYIKDEEEYFRPPENDPNKQQKDALFVDVNEINNNRLAELRRLALEYDVPLRVIPAHLPQESKKLQGLFGQVTLLIDHFAANYYAKSNRKSLRELYIYLLSKSPESRALIFPDTPYDSSNLIKVTPS